MARSVKVLCLHCDSRMPAGSSFCPACTHPTTWATHEERVAWEVEQWRTMRGGAARRAVHRVPMPQPRRRETPEPAPPAPKPVQRVSVKPAVTTAPPAPVVPPEPAAPPKPAVTTAPAAKAPAPRTTRSPEPTPALELTSRVETATATGSVDKATLECILETLQEINDRVRALDERLQASETRPPSAAALVRRFLLGGPPRGKH